MPSRIPTNDVLWWVHLAGIVIGLVLAAVLTHRLRHLRPRAPGSEEARARGTPEERARRIAWRTIPGLAVYVVVFVLYTVWLFPRRESDGALTVDTASIVLFVLWLGHDLYRGVIHPWLIRDRPPSQARSLAPTSTGPMILFSFLAASHLGAETYPGDWFTDPRFLVGGALMLVGVAIDQTVDLRLTRAWRSGQQPPSPFLEVTAPDLLGELCFWMGWALASWSLAGLARVVYQTAMYIPLAEAHYQWQHEHSGHVRTHRWRLIPGIW